MRKSYRRRPQDFKRRILSTGISCRKELLEEEHRWLSMIKSEELGKRYYNLSTHHFGHWSSNEDKRHITLQKLSKGKNHHSRRPEVKAKRIKTIEERGGLNAPNKGVGHETYIEIASGKRKQFPKGTQLPAGYELTKKAKHALRERVNIKERGRRISEAKKGKSFSEDHKMALRAAKIHKPGLKGWATRRMMSS